MYDMQQKMKIEERDTNQWRWGVEKVEFDCSQR